MKTAPNAWLRADDGVSGKYLPDRKRAPTVEALPAIPAIAVVKWISSIGLMAVRHACPLYDRRFRGPDAADKRSRTRGDTLRGSADAITEAAWSNS
jgi:hypothetical protein